MQWFTCIIISPKVQTSGSASICWHHQRPCGGRSRKSMRERERCNLQESACLREKGHFFNTRPCSGHTLSGDVPVWSLRWPGLPGAFYHPTIAPQTKKSVWMIFPWFVTGVPLFQPKLHMRSPDWPGWWFEICLCFHPANDRWNDDPQPRGELPNFLLLTVRRFCCEVSLIEGKRHCWCLTPVFSLLKSNCLGQIQKIYWIRLYLLASS